MPSSVLLCFIFSLVSARRLSNSNFADMVVTTNSVGVSRVTCYSQANVFNTPLLGRRPKYDCGFSHVIMTKTLNDSGGSSPRSELQPSTLQVPDASAKQEILTVLADRICVRILQATQERPRSILELSQLQNITPATITDSIRGMIEAGIVSPIKSPGSAEGYRYRATIRSADVTLTGTGLEINVEINADIPNHVLKRFLATIGQSIPAEAI